MASDPRPEHEAAAEAFRWAEMAIEAIQGYEQAGRTLGVEMQKAKRGLEDAYDALQRARRG